MSNLPEHIKQLNHIRQLLTHPAIDQAEILRRVRKVFGEVGYQRRPYNFRFAGLYRAASKVSESWFNGKDGNVDPDRLHCPPPEKTPLGRCNWAGQPVFYSSSDNVVTVFEVRAKLNSVVVISMWVDKRNDNEQLQYEIAFPGIAIGVKRTVASLSDDDPNKVLLLQDDIFKAGTPLAIKEVDAYIGDLFTESSDEVPNLYLFTSAVAHVLLNDIHETDSGATLQGLIYPSVQSRLSGDNVVLKEQFARSQLKIFGAAMYNVLEHNPGRSSYSLKCIKGLGNHLVTHTPIWKNVHPKHDGERFEFSPETQKGSEMKLLTYEGQ